MFAGDVGALVAGNDPIEFVAVGDDFGLRWEGGFDAVAGRLGG